MKFTSLTALAALTSLGFAAAQDGVPSGAYDLDPAHTSVIWSVSHAGFSMYRGSFGEVSGDLDWNAEDPTQSSLTVTIGADSVIVPDAPSHAGNTTFSEDIAKNALGSEENPTITFTSTSLEKTSDTEGVVKGDLSFNGQTHPAEMKVKLVQAADFMGTPKIGFSGEVTIDRTKWGSDSWVQYNIGKDVTISVNTEFAKEAAE
ncbi:MAG: YceI family protein [Parvularcula sp.]|jgi:polyisoprenoid-binding protein YceI|nr:YceI family protein [Parvularcula sp.]